MRRPGYRTGSRHPEELRRQCVAEYVAGASSMEVSARHAVSNETVRQWVRAAGYQVRPRSGVQTDGRKAERLLRAYQRDLRRSEEARAARGAAEDPDLDSDIDEGEEEPDSAPSGARVLPDVPASAEDFASRLGPSGVVATLQLVDDGMGETRLIVRYQDTRREAHWQQEPEAQSFAPDALAAWPLRVLMTLGRMPGARARGGAHARD